MLVQNKGKYVRHRDTVRVLPGVNDMKEKDWDKFRSHPMNAALIKKGEIVVLKNDEKEPPEDGEGDDGKITSLNADEAIEAINDTFSLELLEQFKSDEEQGKKRKTVLEAIEEQIKELTETPPEDGEESGEVIMADTKPDNVKAIAKHLNKVDLTVLQMYIDDAKLEIEQHNIPSKFEEKLQRYLAAHLATLDYRRPETQKIGDLQTSYKSPDEQTTSNGLEGTEYGKEYKRILKVAVGPSIKMVVV